MDLELAGRVALVGGASSEAGSAVQAALAAEGAIVEGFDGTSAAEALRETLARRGHCDIAVAVLPPLPAGSIFDVGDDETLAAAWDHVVATAELFQSALPGMRDAGWGRLIFVGPIEAKALTEGAGDLVRSVGLAVLGMQKALSGEVGAAGVTCNSVLWDSRGGLAVTSPLEGAAAAVAYLASPHADYMTGVTIAVDGARTGGVY
jgi:NAD(P)-dependent dehydrogenase (short-subunit alcohol dehydrogenase family)